MPHSRGFLASGEDSFTLAIGGLLTIRHEGGRKQGETMQIIGATQRAARRHDRSLTMAAAGALFALAVSIAPAAAADAKGTWFTADHETKVRIADCGGALCGNIVWLKEPSDPQTGKPKTDKNNADAAKRERPLMGVAIVLAMKPSAPDKWQGQVYNASDGKTYTGSITLLNATTLKLEGCALGGLICKAQNWTRTN
jgi:uncharacterized protein (DUF2147 family)